MLRNVDCLTDYEIIQLVLNEDKDYFEYLINRYRNLVFLVVSRMVNDKEDVLDLSQEIFLKLYRNLDKYSVEFKFSTWTMRIATNHIIDFRRKKRIQQVALTDNCFNVQDPSTPLKEIVEIEKNKKVHEAIDDLPLIYGKVLFLYHLEGFSYQEIATEIDEPLSKVKNRISRGRKLLKQNIELSEDRDVYEM